MISAGIHGDEPGGIETILKFFENKFYSKYKDSWELTFLPCINPYGYDFGTRENHQRKDLNRLFKIEEPPLEVLFIYFGGGPFSITSITPFLKVRHRHHIISCAYNSDRIFS